MPSKQQKQAIEQKRKENSNFLIGVFIGLVSGAIVEALFSIFKGERPNFMWGLIFILGIVLTYLFYLFKKINSINDYDEYEVQITKKSGVFEWKEFYNSFNSSIKKWLWDNESGYGVSKVYNLFWAKWKAKFIINTISKSTYISFYEEKAKNKVKVNLIIPNNKSGDNVKNIIVKVLKREAKINHTTGIGGMIRDTYNLKNE